MLPASVRSMKLQELTSVLAGLAAAVGEVKLLAMAAGVTARLMAGPPGLVANPAGD
jgi:hypothetical protein